MITLKRKPVETPVSITYAEAVQRPLKTTFEIASPQAFAGNICMVCSTWKHYEGNIIINLMGGGEVHSGFEGRFIEKNFVIEEVE